MSTIPSVYLRTSTMMVGNQLLSTLQQTQAQMAKLDSAIGTGIQVSQPSDDPSKAAAIETLQAALEDRTQTDSNLNFAGTVLNSLDQAMTDTQSLVVQAGSVGSSQIGIGSNPQTRQNEATVVDGMIQSLMDIANRSTQGIPLFGGTAAAGGQQPFVFVDALGGVQYTGTSSNLSTNIGTSQALAYNSNGAEAFNALSAGVTGDRDLNPQATAGTLLSDLTGANNAGIRKGAIQVTVGGTSVSVDLTDANTLGDVVARVNSAINSVDPAAGSLAVGPQGLVLNANASKTISISDPSGGVTASDLGIAVTANGGGSGVSVPGADLNPKLTLTTRLSDLGVSVDLTSGLKITQGGVTKVADFSSCQTVQDLMNVVSGLNMGVQMQINAGGTGLNLVDLMSGPALSVGEVGGGSTATDLGLRSFAASTSLSSFNFGNGVSNVQGQPDFSITLHDGSYSPIQVNIDGAQTVGDVITDIKNAAQAALGPGTVGNPGDSGTLFNVGLAADGNGLVLEDHTSGGNAFQVANVGTSLAATDLGIVANAGSGSSITGTDNAQIQTNNIFTHLIALRDALNKDDSSGITVATAGLQSDATQLSQAQGAIAVRGQRVKDQTSLSSTMKLTEQTMLSDLQDTDMTTAITQYTQLTQQLQATLKVAAQNMQLSLMNYLQ